MSVHLGPNFSLSPEVTEKQALYNLIGDSPLKTNSSAHSESLNEGILCS